MFKSLKWNTVKMHAAPGTLVYAGEAKNFEPSATVYTYSAASCTERSLEPGNDIVLADGHVSLCVVNGIHDPEFIRLMGAQLAMPPLYLEDVLNTGQRSKLSWLDDEMGFIVTKDMRFDDGRISNRQLSLLWRPGLVVVFQEDTNDLLDGVLGRIRKGKGRIRRSDASYLMVAILDALVDQHMQTLTRCSDAAQELEGKLDLAMTDDLLADLYELKREIILMRNTLIPVRDIFKALEAEDAEIAPDVIPFLQDVVGHHEQTIEGVNALHDILKSMIDYQISLIGIRTNKVMQFLTIVATLFIPLTFIVGVYGMNFKHMPELEWEYGYFIVLGVMAVTGICMLLYFKHKRYL